MAADELDNEQDRSGLINQARVGLVGIILLIVVPPLCRDVRWLIPFLSLLIAPLLILLLLRWLEGKIATAKLAGFLYLIVSLSWLALGITPWLNPVWLLQSIIGLAIGIALMYNRKRAYPEGAAWAVLGLVHGVATNGVLPLLSAVLSAGAMLYVAHAANQPEIGFSQPKRAAPFVLILVILLMIPFPFGKPTTLKIMEGHKLRSMERYGEMIRSGDKADLRPLTNALDDPDGLTRSEAVRQLGSIARMRKEKENGDLNTIIDALVPMMDDAEAREITISQLAAIGNERAIKSLMESLRHYPDMDSRIYRPIFEIFGEYSAQLLIKLLSDSNGSEWQEIRVRRQAIILLGNVREPRVAKAIAKHLGDESRDIRQAAISSLGRMHRSDAVEVLMAGLRDSSYRARRSAAKTLAGFRVPAGLKSVLIGDLVNVIGDEDASVRKYAVHALGNLSDERTLEALLRALVDEDRNVRKRAVRALGNISGESAVDPIIAALEDRYIRRDAAEALGQIGEQRGVNAAVEAMAMDLGHEDMRVSISAAETLGKIGGEDAVSPLTNALRDTRWRVREVAAFALGNIEADYAVQPLIEALNDNEPSVRRAAAEAIRQLGDSQAIVLAIEAMLKDLNDRDPRVRESAAEALGRSGDRNVVPHLMRAAKEDRSHYVRRAALSALAPLTNIQSEYWLMIGPFDNTNRTGFEKQYPPEQEIDLSGVYDGKGQKVRWANYTEGETSNLLPFVEPNQNVVIYALTYIISPDDREVVFRIGSDDGIKIWLNDSLVYDNDVYRQLEIDSDVFPVRLKRGKNRVLIKLIQGTLDCGFHLRVTNSDGNPFDDLGYVNPLEISGQT